MPTVDYLEQPGKLTENIRDNLYAPLILARACSKLGVHLTYFGTGCIFEYDDPLSGQTFSEEDVPNFVGSGYSTVKGFTDLLMRQYDESVLNLRIRMPVSNEDNPRNFVTKLTTYEKICSMPNSVTVLPSLLPVLIRLMDRKITGTLNFTNPGAISHNELLELYREHVDPSFSWENFSQADQDQVLACGRSNNVLNTDRLRELCPDVDDAKDAVTAVMKAYKCYYDQKPEKSEFPDSRNTIVLVTGGCGFIGSHFINKLFINHTRTRIINIDAMYYCASVDNINQNVSTSKRYTHIIGNIQSEDLLRNILKSHAVTHVIHFAAQSHVQASFTDSIQYTKDNVLGTHTLLESVRKYCGTLVKFIHVSTDEVYGESVVSESRKDETMLLNPTNPYAATKAAAEMLVNSYMYSFKMPIIITRSNNVYGAGQHPEKVIPLFIKQLKNNERITIHGNGSALRAFLHVDDAVSAFLCIMSNGVAGEVYNIGSTDEDTSIIDLANILIKLIKGGDSAQWIEYVADRPFNDRRYHISNEKITALGWKQLIGFDVGIRDLLR